MRQFLDDQWETFTFAMNHPLVLLAGFWASILIGWMMANVVEWLWRFYS